MGASTSTDDSQSSESLFGDDFPFSQLSNLSQNSVSSQDSVSGHSTAHCPDDPDSALVEVEVVIEQAIYKIGGSG